MTAAVAMSLMPQILIQPDIGLCPKKNFNVVIAEVQSHLLAGFYAEQIEAHGDHSCREVT